jgi:hypothetical protein
MNAFTTAREVFRFYAGAGARVALRNSALGAAIVTLLFGMFPSPLQMLFAVAKSLTAAETPPWAFYLVVFLGTVLAFHAVPQVSAGCTGWLRSLPASTVVHRRAITAALVLVQAPIFIFVTGCSLGVLLAPEPHLAPLKLLAFGPLAVSAALVAMPSARRVSVTMAALTSVLLIAHGGAVGFVVACIPLAAAEALATRAEATTPGPSWRSLRRLPYHIAWRAISWRAIPPFLSAALPLAATWFYQVNNELTATTSMAAARLGGLVAVVFLLSGLANALHRRRPVWGWERSLPCSSLRRVLHDATSLALGILPLLVVVAAMDFGAAVAIAAMSPTMALVAAAAIRRAGTRLAGAAGEILLIGSVMVTAVAITPWAVLMSVAAMPIAARFAAERERDRPVSSWLELHHSTEGDGLAWSAR